jgi:hypothetical protein
MKKLIIISIIVAFILSLHCTKSRDDQPRRVNAIDEFWVFSGSGLVYIQWRLNTDVWFEEGPELLGCEIYRVDSSSTTFSEIQWLTYPDRQYWGVFDSTVQDSTQYMYYIKIIFHMGSEIPNPYDISDTISAFPFPEALIPIPDAPESLSIVATGDSFAMCWVPPSGCDSLYYLLISEDGQTYDNNVDYWYPNPFEPIWLSTPQYQFYNRRDGQMRYYKVISFDYQILSAPSEPDSVRHE